MSRYSLTWAHRGLFNQSLTLLNWPFNNNDCCSININRRCISIVTNNNDISGDNLGTAVYRLQFSVSQMLSSCCVVVRHKFQAISNCDQYMVFVCTVVVMDIMLMSWLICTYSYHTITVILFVVVHRRRRRRSNFHRHQLDCELLWVVECLLCIYCII